MKREVNLSVRINDILYNTIEKIAKTEDINKSTMIRELLVAGIQAKYNIKIERI